MLDLGADGLKPDTSTPHPASRTRPRIVATRIIFTARVEGTFSLVMLMMTLYDVFDDECRGRQNKRSRRWTSLGWNRST